MRLTIQELVAATHGRLISGDPHAFVSEVSIDTRTLSRGSCFFAIAGPRHDGHDYLQRAVELGARCVVVENLDERATFAPPAIPDIVQVPNSVAAIQDLARFIRQRSSTTFLGITGSNGKTTTKEMVTAILQRAGKTLATRGNLNNQLGVPLTLMRLEPDHRFAVIEMGASRDGDIALLADIARPQAGLITNIGKAHLEGMKSPEGILEIKRALFDALPAEGTAVVNADDALLPKAAESLRCRKISFGLSAGADVRAENIDDKEIPVRFTLRLKEHSYPIALRLPGRFQVMNALAAAAAAYALDVPPEAIVQGLEAFTPAIMRMQLLQHPSGALIINDAYNANPSSVRASVESFCQGFKGRPHWVVLGDMRELGEHAREEHESLGRWLATQKVDRLFLYGRDTRFIQASAAAAAPALRVDRFRKKRYLIAELKKILTADPVVLFKASRSMKLEDVIAALLPAGVAGGAGAH